MVVDIQPNQANGNVVEGMSKRYAVVVGINDYSGTGVQDLSFCSADAEAFYGALLTYCEYDPVDIILFSDGSHEAAKKPTRSGILAAVADMSRRATNQDSVLFFFAGHGARDPQGPVDSYLLTQEVQTSVIANTSIPMNMINDYFKESKARFAMRFFDACHSGRSGIRGPLVNPDVKKHFIVDAEGWATLSACKEDQSAYEDPDIGHGIFSYCLIKGLEGGAATSNGIITFHSLTTYTVEKTIEITKARGLPQTPVSGGYQAGSLLLATLPPDPPTDIPLALVKVQETTIDQLKPTSDKVPQFIADYRAANVPLNPDYIALSQEKKLAFGKKLVERVYEWCQGQERQYHEQLEDIMTITVKHQSIQPCPLNLQLAEYIENSSIKTAVEFLPTYKTKLIKQKFLAFAVLMGPEYEEILDGIKEKQGYYDSAVQLTIKSYEPLMPVCGMVIAIVPSSFGLYLLRYSCSTSINHVQCEHWDTTTFTVRALHAIPFSDEDGVGILKELQDIYPQLVSYLAESCSAKRAYLQSIGMSGQSLA
jgi:hypothetical protein